MNYRDYSLNIKTTFIYIFNYNVMNLLLSNDLCSLANT